MATRTHARNYGGTCGNLTAAVDLFATDEGMVDIHDPSITLFWHQHTEESNSRNPFQGPRSRRWPNIDGVATTGERTLNRYIDPPGRITGKLFPTGKVKEPIRLGGETIYCFIMDVISPVIFAQAVSFEPTGKELSEEIDSQLELLTRLERLCSKAAVHIKIVKHHTKVASVSPGITKSLLLRARIRILIVVAI